MIKTVAIGVQDYETLRTQDCFYIDKTNFIKDWWDNKDSVTLIMRPRRFGKTLNMSMLNCFFSLKYADRGDLFEGLSIWDHERFHTLQGTFPVIFLTFAGVKGKNYKDAVAGIKKQIVALFADHSFIKNDDSIVELEKMQFAAIQPDMDDVTAEYSLNLLSTLMEKHYGKKVLIFLDEYDTPLQEAYIQGYWDEMTEFIRTLFNNTFKTNSSMDRGVMTGITKVSKESIFSDLNNLTVVTTTSDEYATAFGFTEDEVFSAMESRGMTDEDKKKVKLWYDGFTFGKVTDIYNPWSITNYFKKGKLETWWANTSGNSLVGKLIREGNPEIKMSFESLLNGERIEAHIDEQIVYTQLNGNDDAVWSLLLASGYLKADLVYPEYNSLDDTASNALKQIQEKRYDTDLLARGISPLNAYINSASPSRGKNIS